MSGTLFKKVSKCLFQPTVCLELTKSTHTADAKFCFGLCDLIKPKPGQINDCINISSAHSDPHHPSNDPVGPFLIQLICLLECAGLYIVFHCYQNVSPPVSLKLSIVLFILA